MDEPGKAGADQDVVKAVAALIEQRRRALGPSPALSAPEVSTASASQEITPGDVVSAAREIDRLRELRVRPDRATVIHGLVSEQRAAAGRQQGRQGAVVAAWQAVVPPHLVAATSITRVRGGVIHVRADSASIAYELNGLIRDNLVSQLRAHTGTAIARIKVSL